MAQNEIYKELFDTLDIQKGDILLIAADLKKIIRSLLKQKIPFDANEFINYFLDKIDSEGTLLFPTYNFDFCKGVDFDYNTTESNMGFITNIALQREDFIRTKHPIYSFAVSGKLSQKFYDLNNEGAFDSDSPFALLYNLNAKMLLIDVDYQNSFTFVHFVEQQNNAPYRFHKQFIANYTDKANHKEKRVYSMFVRYDYVQTNVNPIGEILQNNNVSKYKNINQIETKLVDLHKSFEIISKDINENGGKNLFLENNTNNIKLIVLDIMSKIDINNLNKYNNAIFLPLTPYSIYICELLNVKVINFHDKISQIKFRDNIFDILNEYKLFIEKQGIEYFSLFYKSCQYISYFHYLDNIKDILSNYKNMNYEVIYITDREDKNIKEFNILSNNNTLVDKVFYFDNILRFKKTDVSMKENKLSKFLKKINPVSLKKLSNKIKKIKYYYDWLYISPKSNKIYFNHTLNSTPNIELFNNFFKDNFQLSNQIFDLFTKDIKIPTNINGETTNFFTFPLIKNFYIMIALNKIGQKIYMYQHGSYYYHLKHKYKSYNLFLNEVLLSDINFVFNDYTKKLFENLGAKKVFSVGSMLFNKPIKKRKKEYDFLYITQGHDYLGNLQYVDFPNSLHSFDGYELYQRHKSIIELFGTKFKDKKIIIRVHPTVLTNGVYVPFWELAESYPNITVDVSIPIHTLIEKSQYIVSDYFTSEFINRELHYKRDILLFQGAPTPIPEETIEDMKKMFILVDTVEDLEEKVKNIEIITKDRPRYDNIIEYYSSKKCDTKKVVTEILKKELNARNNS